MFTSNYGFIVDYLAEVLRDLRKEDRTNEYNRYFELSNSITTRDKTSIAKTFAGMAKIIYPDGEMKEEDAKELLDLAIESRKRVKQQLQKMDETFEEVDFSYITRSTGKRTEVETLELLEYGEPRIKEKTEKQQEAVEVPVANSDGGVRLQLEGKQK